MTDSILKISNGKILTPQRTISRGTVVARNGKITEVKEGDLDVPGARQIDARGHFVAPGFIDIHVHGGGGGDFMDGEVDAFLTIAQLHARYGTTSMVPTTLTSDKAGILKTLAVYEQADQQNTLGARFMGVHLEGPYFAMNQRGAQDPRYIRNPDPAEYEDIISQTSCIRRWSAAPELDGALEFGRYLRAHHIMAAVAHTDAIYEDVVQAVENGYSLITHLYSGMSGVTRRNAFRYAGVVESAYLMDELDVECIADGIHLPPSLLKLAYKIKGADKIALITDAMRAAGTDVTESVLGSKQDGIRVLVEDGVAKLTDRSAFAGSVATADRLIRTMVFEAGIPLSDAVKMMTSTPARIMEVGDSRGTLAAGKDADIVIFNEQIQIQKTIIQGKEVYSL